MKTILKSSKLGVAGLTLACLAVALMITPSASAAPAIELLRVQNNQAFQGLCCFSWLEMVRVTEPAVVVPVVVTWGTDYQDNDIFYSGLSVNGRPCQFFGSGTLAKTTNFPPDGSGGFDSVYFQMTVLPSDGLVTGKNTLTLCGGGSSSPSSIILLGFNTLAARVSK